MSSATISMEYSVTSSWRLPFRICNLSRQFTEMPIKLCNIPGLKQGRLNTLPFKHKPQHQLHVIWRNFTFCWPCIVLWFLVHDQRDAQFFTMYLFLFLTLYVFQAHRAHHQEKQIVSLCVGGRVMCRSEVHFRPAHDTARVTVTRTCVDVNCLSWWWTRCPRKMQ